MIAMPSQANLLTSTVPTAQLSAAPEHQEGSDRGRADHAEILDRSAAPGPPCRAASACDLARGRADVEHPDAEHRGPQRHGVADDRGPPGAGVEQRVGREQMPARDVEQRDQRERPAGGAGARSSACRRRAPEQERAAADHEAEAAEGPGLHLQERQLHHRPVDAPGDGQRDQQKDRLSAALRRPRTATPFRAQRLAPMATVSCAAPGSAAPSRGARSVRSRCTGRPFPSRRSGSARAPSGPPISGTAGCGRALRPRRLPDAPRRAGAGA